MEIEYGVMFYILHYVSHNKDLLILGLQNFIFLRPRAQQGVKNSPCGKNLIDLDIEQKKSYEFKS